MCEKKRKDRGTVLVIMSGGLIALMGALALSIDLGYFYVARNQLQNAVDAAALAGAQGLLAQPGVYTQNGQAVTLAKETAAMNRVDGQPVSLNTNEISFPESGVVRVDATRTCRTFFGQILGVRQVRIRAVAAARVAPATGGTGGWRPWAPPDQFAHGGTCLTPADDDHGPFDPTPHRYNNVTDRDYYKSPYDASFTGVDLSIYASCSLGSPTGFIAPRDVTGQQVELKTNRPNSPGNFYGVALGGRGGSDYRSNIANGWSGTINVGDTLTTEPGNMVGPTRQGVSDLIALDPSARMVNQNGVWVVTSNSYPINESPRIVPIPLFDPTDPPGNGRTTFRVASIASFFIESSNGHSVFGRFIYRKLQGARAGQAPSHPANNSSGAGGYLLGTVQFVDPNQYR